MNRNISIAAGLLTIIAVFLPIMSADILGSVSLMQAEKWGQSAGVAYFYIVLGALIAGVGFMNRRWLNIVNVLLGLIVLFMGLKYWSDTARVELKSIHASAGIGVYLLMLGGLLAIVGAIWGMTIKKPAAPAVA